MKEIKLIAIDIDGTLVNSKKEITTEVKNSILRAQQGGKKIVICTGRPLSGAQQYLDELGLNNQADQYVVSFNGAVVESTQGDVLFKKGLEYADYVDLDAIARKLKLHFHAVGLDRLYTANRDLGHYTIYNSRIVKLEVSYRTPEEMQQIPIIKCMYIDDPDYLDEKIKDPLFKTVADQVTFSKTEPFYYEATAKGVDKGSGLKVLCDYLKINPENVMALGDEANDLAMIKFAGLGVAMGNAVAVTKENADLITADCDHNGVAQAIDKIL
ncbi:MULTISPECIES: Cof-type HAD-IIB family hydrolase [Lactobacillus]|uniref:HAD family phosphatase n=1 Tax=Lactobacillus xujianguonis TaxID=2495899 RepID=A0A437SUL4_9LACO|nr:MULTISPECIES: Cof-type HAD-IIB family hydrolase [Lactobacillus]RVU70626.1 HAD family phosphatase [Lactobacillus xujianguonis]RVU73838.1 HAD family phosphatase [Lactobacillus xujianguonis]